MNELFVWVVDESWTQQYHPKVRWKKTNYHWQSWYGEVYLGVESSIR